MLLKLLKNLEKILKEDLKKKGLNQTKGKKINLKKLLMQGLIILNKKPFGIKLESIEKIRKNK